MVEFLRFRVYTSRPTTFANETVGSLTFVCPTDNGG